VTAVLPWFLVGFCFVGALMLDRWPLLGLAAELVVLGVGSWLALRPEEGES